MGRVRRQRRREVRGSESLPHLCLYLVSAYLLQSDGLVPEEPTPVVSSRGAHLRAGRTSVLFGLSRTFEGASGYQTHVYRGENGFADVRSQLYLSTCSITSVVMTSDVTVDRFYYIFDSREHRALVLDRTTGEEMAWHSIPRIQLIDYVAETASASTLRRFARWCARQTSVGSAPEESAAARLWSAARTEVEAVWTSVRAETTDAVVRAAALGLSQRRAEAARLLTAHACMHPEPRRAAIDAAHMSERWTEFETDGDPGAAVRSLRQRHVDWLLDVLATR